MKRFLFTVFLLFVGMCSALAQTVGDFRSAASGNWEDLATWEEYNGGSWVAADNTPTSSDGEVTIINSHSISILSNLSIDQLIVQTNASISVEPFVTVTLDNGVGTDLTIQSSGSFVLNDDFFFDGSALLVNGSIVNSGILSLNDPNLSSISFNANSSYRHAQNGGSIPAANWNSTSLIEVTGVTNSTPSNFNQNFGNFTWNCTSQSGTIVLGITGTNASVSGDFIVSATGGRVLALSTGTGVTVNVGNLTISGSTRFALTSSGNVTLNTNNFINSSTSFVYLATTGTGNINVNGNFSHSSGTLQGTATSNLTFNGSSEQLVLSSAGTFTNVNFILESTSIVNIGSQSFKGGGIFTMNSGSNLILSDIGGINLGTTSGVIRVSGTRTYNSGVNFEYNGGSSQALGNGFPASDVNLIINNTGGGVNMSSDLTISSGRSLTLTEGTLNIGDGNTLTLNGTVSTTNGGISGTSLSNLEIGGTGAFGVLGILGTNEINNFTINRTSSGTVTLGGDLTVLGDFTQTAGNLILNGNTFTVDNNFTQGIGPSINSDAAASFIVQGAGTLPGSLSFSGDIQTITLDRAATLDFGASNVTAGRINAYSGTITFSGTALKVADAGYVELRDGASFAATLSSPGSFDIEYNNNGALATGNELPTAIDEINNIIKNGTGTVTLGSNVTINGALNINNGGFNAGSQSIDLKGNLLIDGTPTFENAAFTFSGTTNLTGTSSATFGDVTVSGIFNPGADFAINGNLTNNGTLNTSSGTVSFGGTTAITGSNPVVFNAINITGSLTAPSAQSMTVNGNFANSGTFDANSGTVVFGGATTFSGTVPAFNTIQVDGTLNGPTSLTVAGDFVNNGTFVPGTGTLSLTGTGTRQIGGSSTLDLYHLSVNGGTVNNNNADVLVEDGISFAGATTLDVDGSGSGGMTLLSTNTKDAYLGNTTGSTVNGQLTVQRRIYTLRGDNQGYHMMGFPLTGVDIADIQNDAFLITGTFTGASTGTAQGDGFASIFAYDEAAGTTFADGYVAFPGGGGSTSSTFTPGQGYYVFSYLGTVPNTLDGTGVAVTGSQNIPLSYSNDGVAADNGWHMIANPYASAVSWGNVTKTNLGASNIAYIWDPSSGAYVSLSNVVGSELRQGQALFVQANIGGGSVSFEEDDKVTSTSATFYRQEKAFEEALTISLRTGDYSDKARIVYNPEATDSYEVKYDASRLLNSNETFSTLTTDGVRVKYNVLGDGSNGICARSVFFSLEQVVNNKQYTLEFSGETAIAAKDYVLYDHYLDVSTTLTAGLLYDFTVNSDALSKSNERFELMIDQRTPALVDVNTSPVCFNNDANLAINSSQLGIKYLLYKNDQLLNSFEGSANTIELLIEGEQLIAGTNNLEIKAFSEGCDTLSLQFVPVEVSPQIDRFVAISGSSICSGSPSASFTIATQSGIEYSIVSLNGDTVKTVVGNGAEIKENIGREYLTNANNEFTVVASINECSEPLDQSIIINVDNFTINENMAYYANEVCDPNNAFVAIQSQASVSYEFFIDNKLVKTVGGTGDEMFVSIPTEYLSLGDNAVRIIANYNDCIIYEFAQAAVVKLKGNINTLLQITSVDLCSIANATVNIENAQLGKTYQLTSSGGIVNTVKADIDGPLAVQIDRSFLSLGDNTFDVSITDDVCGTVSSSSKARVRVSEKLVVNQVSDQEACKGETATIIVPIDQTFTRIDLYAGEDFILSSTNNEISLLADSTVRLNAIAYTGEGCASEPSFFNFTVNELESPVITNDGQLITANVEADSYQWYFNGSILEGETSKVLIATENGSYSLVATKGSCERSSNELVLDVEQILSNNSPLAKALKLYPNPIKQYLTIDLTDYSTDSYKVSIFTLDGKFLNEYSFKDGLSKIDLESYSTGAYLIKIVTKDAELTKRIIKE